MDLSLDNIELTEIYFVQKLDSREFSDIFIVRVLNQECIMKVHHGRGPREKYEPEDRELDLHIVESTAYYRLKEQGLCDRGIVPNFLGTIRNFDPSLFQPDFQTYLNHFMDDDEYPPSAIFLEYIPGLQMIEPTVNFTQ
ncbi:hypothetical protein N7528_008396 [Penicillium herquei]|nr:hypothetical protein N7528_008396 [Penicillium herquei]